MPGGLIQLISHGAQDAMLTGNPTMTVFKQKNPRITSFACESIAQTMSAPSGHSTITISRNGDLVYGLWLEIKLKKTSADAMAYPAEAFVDSVELQIGGQRVGHPEGAGAAPLAAGAGAERVMPTM